MKFNYATFVALLFLVFYARSGTCASSNDDIAGPIVKLSDLQATPQNLTQAEDAKESKPETIAQLLDAALQKEFTKETSEDAKGGSNFNATVQQEEVINVCASVLYDVPSRCTESREPTYGFIARHCRACGKPGWLLRFWGKHLSTVRPPKFYCLRCMPHQQKSFTWMREGPALHCFLSDATPEYFCLRRVHDEFVDECSCLVVYCTPAF